MPELQVHGTPDYQELAALGWTPDDVSIFSSNINPYGPPPAVLEAVRSSATAPTISTYPDRFCTALREKLATYHGVEPAAILVGNGTADIMWLLAHVCAAQRDAVVVEPTFSEYRNALSLVDARVMSVAHPGWGQVASGRFGRSQRGLSECAADLAAAQPEIVFLCNPNNPTGHALAPAELQRLREGAPDALWIVDEAYADFAASSWSAVAWAAQGGWIVLRSMTKDFSLGGLRLGYLVAAPELVAELYVSQPPWNVNNVAQAAGLAALDELEWRMATTARQRGHVAEMQAALRDAGFSPYASAVNFFLLPVGDAGAVRSRLLQQRLVVRDCTSFGLPEMIRIAVQKPEENARLVGALRQMNIKD